MKKRTLWITLAVTVLLLIGVLAAAILLPYLGAANTMEGGELTLRQLEDGSLKLSWPASPSAEYYRVRILTPGAEEAAPLYEADIRDGNECILPDLPTDRLVTIRVDSAVGYSMLTAEKVRFGEESIEVTTTLDAPNVSNLQWTADPEQDTVSVTYQMKTGDCCRCYLTEASGESTEFAVIEGNAMQLAFGDLGDLPVPEYGQEYRFTFDAYRREAGLVFYGRVTAEMTVVREDLLDRELVLTCSDEGDNVCALSWNETKGDYYEVQCLNPDSGDWETVKLVDLTEVRSYVSPHLPAFQTYSYRVLAVGGQTEEGTPYAAVSEVLEYTTNESVTYATIWPVKDLDAYGDPEKTEVVGKALACTAYCVLEERDGLFGIRLGGMDDEISYIDSNYCMINLPDYIGDLCSYNITNSYSSLYMVHEYEIPDVTAEVTAGYERVQLADGSFLVPLLYPTAQKLVAAAKSAQEQGYRIKIYDSYRPNKATREIYDLTELILENELPAKTYTGKKVSLPTVGEDEVLTYEKVMVGGGFGLSSFLAKSGSLHNLGIALDLTIEDLETGEELPMQTSMHDLSHYSAVSRNNDNAKTLSAIMKGAGFGGLTSEWWHFQDNEIRSAIKLPTVWAGVNPAGWVAANEGWRYRNEKGSFYYNCTVTIGDKEYTFNMEGLVQEDYVPVAEDSLGVG